MYYWFKYTKKFILEGIKNGYSVNWDVLFWHVLFTVVGAQKGKEPIEECLPCGYCRQFMSEFVDDDFKIYTVNDGEVKEFTMKEILPFGFKF